MPGRRLLRAPRGTAGFTLIEVMVALAMLSIVSVALAGFFISTLKGSQQLKVVQNAQVVADGDMELIHSVTPADLVYGRTKAAVAAQWSAAPSKVTALTASLSQAYDSSATSHSVLVPLTGEPAGPEATSTPGAVTPVIDGTSYTVTNYIGSCNQPTEVTGTTTPVATPSPSGTNCNSSYSGNPLYEVIIAVSWTAASGEGCTSNVCYYLDTALISPATSAANPEFLDGNGATVTAEATPSDVTSVDQVSGPAYSGETYKPNPAINPLTVDTPGSWQSNSLQITAVSNGGSATASDNTITSIAPSATYSGDYEYVSYSIEGTNGTTYYSSVAIPVYPYAPSTTITATAGTPTASTTSCGSTGSGKDKVDKYYYTYAYTATLDSSVGNGTGVSITSVGTPGKGTASLSSGTVTYSYSYEDPTCTIAADATGASGTTTFSYAVTDSTGDTSPSGTATVDL